MRLLVLRRWRSRPLLLPLVELLFLLLLLLRIALLHRRRWLHQRMRLLRRGSRLFPRHRVGRRTKTPVRRLRVAVFRLLAATLRLRAALLLVDSWLRVRHRPYLAVVAAGRSERTEAILRRLRAPARILIHLHRPRWCRLSNQRLLIQMPSRLRLPLLHRARRRRRYFHRHHRTIDHCGWRLYRDWTARTQHAAANRLHARDMSHRS